MLSLLNPVIDVFLIVYMVMSVAVDTTRVCDPVFFVMAASAPFPALIVIVITDVTIAFHDTVSSVWLEKSLFSNRKAFMPWSFYPMALIQDIDPLCTDIVDRGVIAGFDARGEDALSNVGVFSEHFYVGSDVHLTICWVILESN